MQGQLSLFANEDRKVVNVLEEYVDYSDMSKEEAKDTDLAILEDFINYYGETMIPLLDGYIKKVMKES
jgi:hypothetical protein